MGTIPRALEERSCTLPGMQRTILTDARCLAYIISAVQRCDVLQHKRGVYTAHHLDGLELCKVGHTKRWFWGMADSCDAGNMMRGSVGLWDAGPEDSLCLTADQHEAQAALPVQART